VLRALCRPPRLSSQLYLVAIAAPFRFVQISVAIAAFVNGSKDSVRYPICSPASKNCSFAGEEWMLIVLWLVVAMFAQF
jgi:hypothetical protein